MKRKRVVVLVIVLFLFIAFCSIGFGFYINYLAQPKNVFSMMIRNIHEKVEPYFNTFDSIFIGDQFTVQSTINFDLDSEYYLNRSTTDESASKNYRFLQNLSKMNTTFLFVQDASKESAFMKALGTIGEEKLVDARFVVDNSTAYYFVEGASNHYINNGTCNYFENLKGDITSVDNLTYLKSFILESFQNQLKDEYFHKYEVNQTIYGSSKDVYQISLRFTNQRLITILNAVLKDLKKDERANAILTNLDSNFGKRKIKADTTILGKGESYTLNIYTSKVFNKPYKYELVHINQDEQNSLVYELGSGSDTILYLENSQVVYYMVATFPKNDFVLKISDSKNNSLGEFKIDREKMNRIISFSFADKIKKYDLVYSSKYSNYKKNKGYENEKIFSFKYMENKESRLNGTITVTTEVSGGSKIEEDFSEAILASKMTEEEKEAFQSKPEKIRERLER